MTSSICFDILTDIASSKKKSALSLFIQYILCQLAFSLLGLPTDLKIDISINYLTPIFGPIKCGIGNGRYM